MLVLRINVMLGINDLVFVVLTGIISDTMSLAFSFLPTLVLFSKITPLHIEATVFAMLTGIFNFVNNVGGPLLGSFFTRYVGIDGDHLDKYYILLLIQLGTVIISFFYIWLIPLRSEINEVQKEQIKKANEEK
jgi:hypothetical protein